MKTSLMCTALFLFAGSACAQQSRPTTPTCTSQGYNWSGGGYGGGYGGYGGSLSSGSGRPVRWEPPREFLVGYARNDGEFVPSTFMDYDDAVALGKQILAEQAADQSENPKFSVAAAARANRAVKVTTMRLRSRVAQDGDGRLVICNLNGNDCHRP
jgi:hypothetical protein